MSIKLNLITLGGPTSGIVVINCMSVGMGYVEFKWSSVAGVDGWLSLGVWGLVGVGYLELVGVHVQEIWGRV